MSEKSSFVLYRMLVVTFFLVLSGGYIYSKDKSSGIALLTGGTLAILYGIYYYAKSEKNDKKAAAKAGNFNYRFDIVCGIILLVTGITLSIIQKSIIAGAVLFYIIVGIILIMNGIYRLKSEKMKTL